MNEIEKFLRKLKKAEQDAFLLLFEQLEKDYTKVPGVKKLVGKKNLYRIRMGKYRIIFSVMKEGLEIIRIKKRAEGTYKNL
jgi:mRNA-degrading endonuclease RelE of RelBE toxin-antitoxin system